MLYFIGYVVFATWLLGAVAQLGEHLICIQGVAGSIPVSSTIQAGDKKKTLEDEDRRVKKSS